MKNPLRNRKKKLGKKKGEEGYGPGKVTIDFGDDVLLDEETMVERLLLCLNAPDYRPPTLPSIAVDLLGLSRQADVDFDDVVGLLEQDSMIAGRILKMVQSPIYSGVSELTSLHDALVRLGLKTLRDVVMQIAMNMKVFKSPDYADTMEMVRRHCTMTAHISKSVAQRSSQAGEYAFLAGLLHDVGIAGTLLALSEHKGGRTKPPDLISIWPAVDRVHTQAAEIMADHWNLPAEIKTVLGGHHQVLFDGEAHALAGAVCIAEDIAHQIGFGVLPKDEASVDGMTELEMDCVRSHTSVDRSSPRTLEHARKVLELDDEAIELLVADSRELVEKFS